MTIKYCFLLVVISQIFIVNKAESQGYETKYDDVDLDELLKNDRLRHSYVKCLLGEGTFFSITKLIKMDFITDNI